jgi:phage terminase large subunit-like protein
MGKEANYAKDPISFLEDHYILPETMHTIKLQPWQKDYVLGPLFYDLDDKGKRKYNIAVIGHPKKGGKSAFAAGIGVYFCFCDEPFGEIIVASNSRDQASMIIYTKMRRSIMLDPALKKACVPMRKEKIEVHSTGTTARCIAQNYETAAGLNPNLTIFDELW